MQGGYPKCLQEAYENKFIFEKIKSVWEKKNHESKTIEILTFESIIIKKQLLRKNNYLAVKHFHYSALHFNFFFLLPTL